MLAHPDSSVDSFVSSIKIAERVYGPLTVGAKAMASHGHGHWPPIGLPFKNLQVLPVLTLALKRSELLGKRPRTTTGSVLTGLPVM